VFLHSSPQKVVRKRTVREDGASLEQLYSIEWTKVNRDEVSWCTKSCICTNKVCYALLKVGLVQC